VQHKQVTFFGEFKPVKLSLLTNSTYDATISLTTGRHLYIIIIFKVFVTVFRKSARAVTKSPDYI